MREIAHVSDSAIDHIEALLAILLSLQLDPHNMHSSSNVVEVGQILFFINQTLQMILMVLVMVVD